MSNDPHAHDRAGRTETILVRVSREEKRLLAVAADRLGMGVSTWLRVAALRETRGWSPAFVRLLVTAIRLDDATKEPYDDEAVANAQCEFDGAAFAWAEALTPADRKRIRSLAL